MFRNFISIAILALKPPSADSSQRKRQKQLWMQDKAQVDAQMLWNGN
jgi:hypothetical protein